MHRKLPEELNLHILSFLSSTDIIKTNLVNKNSRIAKDRTIWERELENTFFVPNVRELKNPEEEYKNIIKEQAALSDLYLEINEAYFFSFEIQKRTMAGTIPDPLDRYRSTPLANEVKVNIARHDNLVRIDGLDKALLRSKEEFKSEFKELKNRYPQINSDEIKELTTNITKMDNDPKIKSYWDAVSDIDRAIFFMNVHFAFCKIDADVLLRMVFNKDKSISQEHLGNSLHIACAFLSIKTARVLISLGANVNHFKDDYDIYGGFSQTTPLYEAMNAIRYQRAFNPSQSSALAIELIILLLSNGADPNARIYLSTEDEETPEIGSEEFERSKKSIRELCFLAKEEPNDTPVEVLDLIIDADNVIEDNKHSRKRLR